MVKKGTSPTKSSSKTSKKVSNKSTERTAAIDVTKTTKETLKKTTKNETKQLFECPKDNEASFQLFFTSCNSNKECKGLGPNYLCCKLFGSKRCIEGKVVQPKEPKHERKHFDPI